MKNQGTILSLLTPIETFNEICEEEAGNILEYDEVNSILPYAKEAKEAARDLSQFVLEHVNSSDNDTKRVVNYIIGQLHTLDLFGFAINNFEGSKPSVDNLNHSILSIKKYISNTMMSCSGLLRVGEDSSDTKNAEDSKIYEARIAELEAKVKELQLPVENLNAPQKLRMELTCCLLNKAGMTDEILKIQGNKQKAASVMSLLLDIKNTNARGNEAQTCATYLSDRNYPRERHMATIEKINPLLQSLGIDIQL